MLDFASLGLGGASDIRFVPDNTLLAEFVTMQRLWKASAAANTYDPFTCSVNQDARYECLDIASAANPIDRFFGGSCRGSASDGYIGAYDIAKLLWIQFESPPYDSLTRTFSAIFTIYPRVGTAARCSYHGPLAIAPPSPPAAPGTPGGFNGIADWNVMVYSEPCISGYAYVSRLALPPPPPSAVLGRLLAEAPYDPTEMQVVVDNWSKTDLGAWVRYSVAGIQVVIELFVGGLQFDPLRQVRLSNAPIPPRGECTDEELEVVDLCAPTSPDAMEVRFARRLEYTDSSTGACAGVLPGFGSSIALISNTLALRQDPPRTACAIDVLVWIPNAEYKTSIANTKTSEWLVSESSACLLRGSTVAQVTGVGQVLRAGTCLSVGNLASGPSLPPAFQLPQPPPPPVGSVGLVPYPPSHPPSTPTDAQVAFPVVVFFVPVMVLFLGWLGYVALSPGGFSAATQRACSHLVSIEGVQWHFRSG